MKEKILGAIMGLYIGDALGVPVEFASRESLRANHATNMRGYIEELCTALSISLRPPIVTTDKKPCHERS